jgi:hypothetical protein
MRVTKIGFIPELPDGTNLEAVRGKITAVYELKSGTNSHGDWSMQAIVLNDGKDSVRVILKDREEAPMSWKNKTILITAGERSNKPIGIVAEDNEHDGKVTRRLRVTPSATIEFEDGGQSQSRQERPQERREEPRRDERPAQREQTRQERPQEQREPARHENIPPADDLKLIKQTVLRVSNLWGICYDAAVAQAFSIHERHDYVPVPAQVGILADKIFQESIRRIDFLNIPLKAGQFKGRPLAQLIPKLQESMDATTTHRIAVEEKARQASKPQLQQERPPVQDDTGWDEVERNVERGPIVHDEDDIPF